MKTFKQFKEDFQQALAAHKKPVIDTADRISKYVTGPNGKPKKISYAAHEIYFSKNQK